MYGSVYSKLFECFVFRIMSFTSIEKLKTKYTSNKSNYKLKLFSKKFPYSIIIPSLDKHTFAKILSSILNYLDITRKMNKNFSFLYVLHWRNDNLDVMILVWKILENQCSIYLFCPNKNRRNKSTRGSSFTLCLFMKSLNQRKGEDI